MNTLNHGVSDQLTQYQPIIAASQFEDTAPTHAVDSPILLEVEQLKVALVATGEDVVDQISFHLKAGEILGLVGESGSGKSTVSSALLGFARHGAKIVQGSIRLNGLDILSLNNQALRQLRGKVISHVAQDPATALNPAIRIGKQLQELLHVHAPQLTRIQVHQRITQVLTDVGLPIDSQFLSRFAHQLSGGQQQRVLLALAFVLQPKLIVLDEPTTALDVTTQTLVLNIIRKLCRDYAVAAVYVSHDLTVVKDLVDRMIVLYAGRIVEDAPLHQLFKQPAHPYTQGLLAAIPDVAERRALIPIFGQAPAPGTRPQGCAFAPRCPQSSSLCSRVAPSLLSQPHAVHRLHRVACYHPDQQFIHSAQHLSGVRPTESRQLSRPLAANQKALTEQALAEPLPLLEVHQVNTWYGQLQVLFDISLTVPQGQCLALVGESGSGKTTLSRALAGLGEQATGMVYFAGRPLSFEAKQRKTDERQEIQYVFQNPYRALNPAHTVGETLVTAIRHFFKVDRVQAKQQALQALAQVSLQEKLFDAFPRELSGGERQRVAIARALVCQPKLLICDEITSALDVSVQASILALLQQLQQQGLTILFVTHNLGVVRAIADQVVVLQHGKIVEQGEMAQVLDQPQHPYTRQLLEHAPSLLKVAIH